MNFIIIGAARTKSSYLVNLFNTHPDVLCHSELFHQEKAMLRLNKSATNSHLFDVRWRDRHVVDFIQATEQETRLEYPEKSVIGSKLLLYAYQINRGLDALLATKPKVIFLHRQNKLAWYSSLKIAIATDIWETFKPLSSQAQITFHPQEYSAMVENQICLDVMTLKILQEQQVAMLKLEYEEIGTEACNEKVLAFLNLKSAPLSANSLQQNSRNLLARFTNPGMVKRFMIEAGHESWLSV